MMARQPVQDRGITLRLDRPYRPLNAWRLAGLYWLLLVAMSALAGTPQWLVNQPLVTTHQLRSLSWWGWMLACVSLTVWVYGVDWSRQTLRFGRRIRPLTQSAFGLCWGVCLGLWMLTLIRWGSSWPSVQNSGKPLAFLVSFGLISVWQALSQSFFWGVYVAPEHDTPGSNRSKVWRCHIPHLVVSMMFFFWQGNAIVFILLQVLSLALMSVASAMPAWWDKAPQRAATVRLGPFGLLRTHGWEGGAELGRAAG